MLTDKRSSAATDAERKRAERERKREAGLVKIEIWARSEHVKKIRDYASRLLTRA